MTRDHPNDEQLSAYLDGEQRDEASDAPIGERAALDQITLRADAPADAAEAVRADTACAMTASLLAPAG